MKKILLSIVFVLCLLLTVSVTAADAESTLTSESTIGDSSVDSDGESVASVDYGYILQTAWGAGDTFSSGWQVKMLTTDGIATYDLYIDISINDASAVASDTLTSTDTFFNNYIGSLAWRTTPSDNVVKYQLATDGTIKSIRVVTENHTSIAAGSVFNNDTNKLGSELLAQDVIVFDITYINTDDVKTKDISVLVDGGMYGGEVFDNAVGDGHKIFVMTSADVSFDAQASVNVVSSVRKTIYKNYDNAVVVRYYKDGEGGSERKAIFTPDSTNKNWIGNHYTSLKKGDVFLAFQDSENAVTEYVILATVNNATKSFDVVPGAFAAAYGSEFKNNNLADGVAYIVTSFKGVNDDIAYFEDCTDTDDYAFRIPLDVASYNYLNDFEGGSVKSKSWGTLNLDVPEDGKAISVFIKLYNGEVTNIYAYNEMDVYKASVNPERPPVTNARVIKTSDGCIVNVYAINSDGCTFFICAYKGNSLVVVKSISYSDVGKPIALTGDIDNIKVIAVDSVSNLKPLTKSAEVPESLWKIDESCCTMVIRGENLNPAKSTVDVYNDVTLQYKEQQYSTYYSTINVRANPKVFINNVEFKYESLNLSDYKTKILFKDSDYDDVVDIINITIYEHAIVKSVSPSEEKIYFLDGSSISFDSENETQIVNIYKENGEKITLNDINRNDVLAMVVHTIEEDGTVIKATDFSLDGNNNQITIYNLGRNTHYGAVTESDDSQGLVCIGGAVYKVASDFVDGNYSQLIFNGAAKLGEEGIFYLAIDDKIIGFKDMTGGPEYAYILQATYNAENSSSIGWKVKMLTSDGVATYDLYRYISISDASGVKSNAVTFFSNYTGTSAWSTTPADNVVKYELATDGTIKYIAVVTADHTTLAATSSYNANTNKVGDNLLSPDVLVFDLTGTTAEDVNITYIDSFAHASLYGGELLDNSDLGYKVFVMTSKTLMFDAQAGFNVVKSVRRTTYDGDDNTIIVKYYTEGICEELIAIFTSASSNKNSINDYTTLKIGDVFVANTDRDDVVSDYVVLAKVNEMTKSFDVVSGAFAVAYGPQYKSNNLTDGVADIVTYFKEIKNGVAYFEDGTATDDYGFRIGANAAAYNFTAGFGGDIVEVGDYLGSNVDNADMYDTNYDGIPDIYEAANVIIKLYDGEVTDIYSFNEMVPQLFFN